MEKTVLTLRFSFQPWEHFRALRAISRRGPGRVFRFMFGIVIPLLFLLFVLQSGAGQIDLPPLGFSDSWIVIFLPIVYFLFVPSLQLWKAFHLTKEEPSKEGEQIRSITGEGLTVTGPRMSMELKWEGMKKIRETKEFFLFFGSKSCAMYIPKRLLTDQEGVKKVRNIILANAPDKAKMISKAG